MGSSLPGFPDAGFTQTQTTTPLMTLRVEVRYGDRLVETSIEGISSETLLLELVSKLHSMVEKEP